NVTTERAQLLASVSLNNLGHSVVSWTSYKQDESDSYGVYAREFDANGDPLGNEFLVNTTVVQDQSESSVSLNDAGHYIVVWTSFLQDGSGNGVFAQGYLYPNEAPSADAGGPYMGDEGA